MVITDLLPVQLGARQGKGQRRCCHLPTLGSAVGLPGVLWCCRQGPTGFRERQPGRARGWDCDSRSRHHRRSIQPTGAGAGLELRFGQVTSPMMARRAAIDRRRGDHLVALFEAATNDYVSVPLDNGAHFWEHGGTSHAVKMWRLGSAHW